MDYEAPPANFALMCELRSRLNVSEPIFDEQLRWLLNSAHSNACQIFLDPWQRPQGYLCWAAVDLESLCRLARTGIWPCQPHEWEEGGFALLLDLVVCAGSIQPALAQFKEFLRRHPRGAFARRGQLTLYNLAGRPRTRKFHIGSDEARAVFSQLEAAKAALP